MRDFQLLPNYLLSWQLIFRPGFAIVLTCIFKLVITSNLCAQLLMFILRHRLTRFAIKTIGTNKDYILLPLVFKNNYKQTTCFLTFHSSPKSIQITMYYVCIFKVSFDLVYNFKVSIYELVSIFMYILKRYLFTLLNDLFVPIV